MVDKSTDSHVIFDKTPLEIGPTTNETFDYKVFKLFYSVIDNTVVEDISCFDYRKLHDSYGDCNYRALEEYIYSVYGCYPPWIEQAGGDTCEKNN